MGTVCCRARHGVRTRLDYPPICQRGSERLVSAHTMELASRSQRFFSEDTVQSVPYELKGQILSIFVMMLFQHVVFAGV